MSIVFQSFTNTEALSLDGPSQSLVVTKPSGIANGDVMYLVFASAVTSAASGVLTADAAVSGFTLVTSTISAAASTVRRMWVFRKAVTNAGAEPADYTVSIGSANTINLYAALLRVSGVNPSVSEDAVGGFSGDINSTTLTFPSVTTANANSSLMMIGYGRRGSTTATFNDGVEFVDVGNDAVTGMRLYVGYLTQAAAGASGAKTATLSSSRENNGIIIALNEASGVLAITSITPSQIDSGESFTIAGTGFGSTQGLSLVQIGGVTQTPTSWSDSSITCTATRGSQSMGNATLTIYKM